MAKQSYVLIDGVWVPYGGPPGPPGTGVPPGGTPGQVLSKSGSENYDTEWQDQSDAGHTVQYDGISLAEQTGLNFTGLGVTVIDDPVNDRTSVAIPVQTLIQPDPPDPASLPEGTWWIDDDSDVDEGPGGHIVQDEGVAVAPRTNLNFTGAGVTVTDDDAGDTTIVTIAVDAASEIAAHEAAANPHPIYLTQEEGDTVYALKGSVPTRSTATKTTASLASLAYEVGTIALSSGYRLYRITTTAPCRFRLYTTGAKLTADTGRIIGVDPTGDHGLMFEFVSTTGLLSADLTPLVDGFDGKPIPDGEIPCSITNTGPGSTVITVSLTYMRSE